ncbi:histidine phosphatase family protein [Actinomyces bowdenii]|uniref:histidine phosphatase family protein n=1 Tax=Actinomyces bowdenii TaxID=131109 RepID=UPI00214AD113|nr:histidine phosphatase family protein [Actinomyces bowdenii]MCR2051704.1 histidine phosphatase family protein [Actinomyces bowdenii]
MARVFVVTPPQDVQQVQTLGAPVEDEDSSLSPQAVRDAQLVADRLQMLIPFDVTPALYTSDRSRDSQTMGLIAEAFGACPTYLSDLRAMGPLPPRIAAQGGAGALESDAVEAVGPATRPESLPLELGQDGLGRAHHGDRACREEGPPAEVVASRREWVEQAYRAMATIESDPVDQRIVVTHGGAFSAVVAAWLRIPIEACCQMLFHAQHGSITVLEEDGEQDRVLRALGDTAHLLV